MNRLRRVPDALLAAPLCQAVYVSRATRPFSRPELQFLANKASDNNGRLEITGLLVYLGGNFLQILEGRPERVDRLLEFIWRDQRHKDFRMLHVVPIAARTFAGWNMGVLDMHDRPPLDETEVATLSDLLARNEARARDHGAAAVLLALRKLVPPGPASPPAPRPA